MYSTEAAKTVVQCDFDGTVTEEDVSFLLLNAFTDGSWRQLLKEYREQKVAVSYFNAKAFAMIKADKQTLVEFTKGKVKIRTGFPQLVAYCQRRDFRFVIVSNGLDFYIDAILKDIGMDNIEVLAATTRFGPEGLEAIYVGPDGSKLENGLKDVYIRSFLREGYQVIYVGDGISDISPARYAQHVFARGELLTHCQKANLNCMPFDDLNDVVHKLELL